MAKEFNKIPPQNVEAEQSLLGALLIDKEAMIKVGDLVNPEDFYKDAHKMIYEGMLDLYATHEPIDILSLSNKIEEKGKLKEIGGKAYLMTLTQQVPTAGHVVHYGNIVQKKATLRRLITTAAEITELGFNENKDVDFLLDHAEKKLFSVSQKYLKQLFVPIKNVLSDAFDRIDDLHKQKGAMRGVPTGFTELDKVTAGLQKSDLIILAARPSMGKTSLALDIARQIAVQGKKSVGLFSLEMSKEQLVDRMICAEANVDLWKMRTGKLSDSSESSDFPRIGAAMGTLSEAAIYIDDSATLNIMEIRTKARRLQMEHGLDAIIIDYLQLIEGRGQENRVQEISEITRSLKGIARELNIPILALSQLSRAVEARQPPIPKLADLRVSGSIEQDADIVMFIYREEYYKKDTPRKGITDILIAKHRNGPTGRIELFFDPQRASFKNLDKSMQNMQDTGPMDPEPPSFG